jgi:hypothetical protein
MKRITNEIKAKYFSLYYYRQVLGKYIDSDELAPIEDMNPCLVDYIELTPLEQISDEHKVELSKILSNGKNELTINTALNGSEWNHFNYYATQYLLSKGYALPYMDYSVSDLVENGTIILKTK